MGAVEIMKNKTLLFCKIFLRNKCIEIGSFLFRVIKEVLLFPVTIVRSFIAFYKKLDVTGRILFYSYSFIHFVIAVLLRISLLKEIEDLPCIEAVLTSMFTYVLMPMFMIFGFLLTIAITACICIFIKDLVFMFIDWVQDNIEIAKSEVEEIIKQDKKLK